MTGCLGREVTALADGSLPPARRERALAHVAGCDRCRALLDAERSVRSRLAAADGPAVPGDLVLRLAAIAARPDDVALVPRPPAATPPRESSAVPHPRTAPARRLVAVGGTAGLVTVAGLAVLASAPTAATSVPGAATLPRPSSATATPAAAPSYAAGRFLPAVVRPVSATAAPVASAVPAGPRWRRDDLTVELASRPLP